MLSSMKRVCLLLLYFFCITQFFKLQWFDYTIFSKNWRFKTQKKEPLIFEKLYFQAHLSARTVKAFTTKVMRHNGNVSHTDNEEAHDIHHSSQHIASIEHTNDDVITNRISKSSGRLWISGTIQQSLKRISMPIPEVYHHIGDTDTRLTQSYRGNGNLLSNADSFSDLSGDIFDTKHSNRKHSEDVDSECSSVNGEHNLVHDDDIVGRDPNDEHDDDMSVYDTHL